MSVQRGSECFLFSLCVRKQTPCPGQHCVGLCARGLCETPIEAARLTETSPLSFTVARLEVFPYDNGTFNDGWIVEKALDCSTSVINYYTIFHKSYCYLIFALYSTFVCQLRNES